LRLPSIANSGLISVPHGSLLAMQNRHRKPTLPHLAMAHLTELSLCKLILSINFDTLLETAFRLEGLTPSVFEVTKDSDVPDAALINKQLSIVKLHGGSFGLRLGEELDHELDERTRERVLSYFPPNAVLLVIGFSGMERRMMQLLHLATLRSSEGSIGPRIIWMRFEQSLNEPVKTMRTGLRELGKEHLFFDEQLTDSGEFLLNLYQECTGTLPKTRNAYSCLSSRLAIVSKDYEKLPPGIQVTRAISEDRQVYLFMREEHAPLTTTYAPSCAISRYANELSRDYRVIWIDLEEHHTVGGVVLDILNRIRVVDPGIPPFLVPANEGAPSPPPPDGSSGLFPRSVRAIHLAMRRGRYLLVFDSLEAFGRPETVHHGLPYLPEERGSSNRSNLINRVGCLTAFLDALLCITYENDDMRHIDWKCAISLDHVSPRHLRADTRERAAHVATEIQKRMKMTSFHDQSTVTNTQPTPRVGVYPLGDTPAVVSFPKLPDSPDIINIANLAQTCRSMASFDEFLFKANQDSKFNASLLSNLETMLDSMQSVFKSTPMTKQSNASGSATNVDRRECCISLLILSCVRRPRQHSTVISLLTAFWAPDWQTDRKDKKKKLRKILSVLAREGVVLRRRKDNGSYWIPRFGHEAVYKLLTERIRPRYLDAITSIKDAIDPFHCLTGLVAIHSRAARHYYLHIYQRSHDTASLREHFYHRISAIKYLKLLRDFALRVRQMPSQPEAELMLAPWLNRLATFAAREMGAIDTDLLIDGEQLAPGTRNLTGAIVQMDEVRLQLMLSFRNTLLREKNNVLSTLSTDAWLNWIEQVLTIDLSLCVSSPFFSSLVGSSPEKSTTADPINEIDATGTINTPLVQAADHVASLLLDYQIQLFHEQGNWNACASAVCAQLRHQYSIWTTVISPSKSNWSADSISERLSENDPAGGTSNAVVLIEEVVRLIDRVVAAASGSKAVIMTLIHQCGVEQLRNWLSVAYRSIAMAVDCCRRNATYSRNRAENTAKAEKTLDDCLRQLNLIRRSIETP
jgi:hypothetical protein